MAKTPLNSGHMEQTKYQYDRRIVGRTKNANHLMDTTYTFP